MLPARKRNDMCSYASLLRKAREEWGKIFFRIIFVLIQTSWLTKTHEI